MITCDNVASMCADYFQSVDEVFAEDAILYAAPMSHGAGLYNFMHIMRGCRHIVPASGAFDPAEIEDEYLTEHEIPVITTSLDTYGSVVKYSRIEVKINTHTLWKVQRAIEMFKKNVDLPKLLELS